ncbi:MAG: tRNA (adenosine(37)-N6)-threonylcarbamoyltransferase complex ATPase subunit type 1 TsaE [Spirochaetia bacterium]|nr:tRNA (adenosine(37)-N6)-threonylcarbamoyltransferase complex ATPase subunit type 1 TsaE [Spirochaetia bacterium]
METSLLAKSLAAGLKPGMKIILSGPMGSGKTTLVRLILDELGYRGMFQSPSFTLVQEYPDLGSWPGRLFVRHLDLDRIKTREELQNLGVLEMMEDDSVLLIEWGEKFPELLPLASRRIRVEIISETERVWSDF